MVERVLRIGFYYCLGRSVKMVQQNKAFSLVVSALLFVVLGSQVEAAKGIKKNLPAGSNQTVMGTILNINNSDGTFTLRSSNPQKKLVQVNGAQMPVVNKQAITNTFHVMPSTSVIRQDGTAVGVSSIRPGLRARVVSTNNHQANVVQIYVHQRTSGYVTRHRTHVYRPQVYQHHRRHSMTNFHHRSRR